MKKTLSAVTASALVLTSVTACAPGNNVEACRQADVGVVWTSAMNTRSTLEWFRSGERAGTQRFDGGRIEGPGAAERLRDGRIVLVAKGTAKYEDPKLVSFDGGTCKVDVAPGPVAPMTSRTEADSTLAAGNVNGEANVTRTTPKGDVTASVNLPGFIPSQFVSFPDKVVLFGTREEGSRRTVEARVLDPVSLTPRSTWDAAAMGGAVTSTQTVRGQTYVVAETGDAQDGSPGRTLGKLDPTSGALTVQTLPSPLPASILRADKDLLYVGHTFMNEAFAKMSDYRDVSIVDPATQKVDTKQVDFGIVSMDFVGGRLRVIGLDANNQYHLTSYEPGTLKRIDDVALHSPEGNDYFPSVVLPGSKA